MSVSRKTLKYLILSLFVLSPIFVLESYAESPLVHEDIYRTFVWLATPEGSFDAVEGSFFITTPLDVPPSLDAADFDNDGLMDLLTADKHSLTIFSGLGDGSFQRAYVPDLSESTIPIGARAGDFNGDGDADVFYLDSYNGVHANICLGDGGGLFECVQRRTDQAEDLDFLAYGPDLPLATGDVNGDAFSDFLISSHEGIWVFYEDGDFSEGHKKRLGHAFLEEQLVHAIALGDVTANGHLDLAVLSANAYVQLFFGNEAGEYGRSYKLDTESDPQTIALGDVTGDGQTDVVMGYIGEISILPRGEEGEFGEELRYTTEYNDRPIVSITLADFNDDGRTDIASAVLEVQGTPESWVCGTVYSPDEGCAASRGGLFLLVCVIGLFFSQHTLRTH